MLKIIASDQKGETESPNLKYVNKIFYVYLRSLLSWKPDSLFID